MKLNYIVPNDKVEEFLEFCEIYRADTATQKQTLERQIIEVSGDPFIHTTLNIKFNFKMAF